MPRLLGVDIPANKKIRYSLRYIYGIGPHKADIILKEVEMDPDKKAKDLTDEETSKIVNFIQNNFKVEGELRRDTRQHIRRLIDISCYKGFRHRKGLPVRGQRTRCNARTRKGPKAKIGGLKRK